MLLEPDKPKPRWRKIVVGHLVLYALSVVLLVMADRYFYNRGDATLVFIGMAVLTIVSFVINRLYLRRKAILLTLLISPGSWLVLVVGVVNLLSLSGVLH